MNHNATVLPLVTVKRQKKLRKQLIIIVCIVAAILSLHIAYANIFESAGDTLLAGIDALNPIDDIFSAMLLFLFKLIVSVVAGLLDALIDPIQKITSYSMDQLNQIIPLYDGSGNSYGELASKYIKNLAQFMWIILSLMGILANMIYTTQGNKKAESPGRMFVGIVISGVLMFIAQDLMFLLFDSVIQPLTSEFSKAIEDSSLLQSSSGVFDMIGSSLIQGFSTGLISIILAIIMLIIIGVNFFKLALEMVQRYVIIAVICILSPLAFAAGACQETRDIAKRWFRMFWSQGILLFLNVWCIGISLQCMINVQSYSGDILIWALITYGFIKVAMQLDDILRNAGLDITKQTAGLVEDLWTAGRVMGGLIGGASALAGAGKSLAHDLPKVQSGEMSAAQAIQNMTRSFNPGQHPIMAAAFAPVGAAAAAYTMRTGEMAKKDMLQDFAKTGQERKQNRKNYNTDLARKTAKDVLSKSSDQRLRDAAANGDIKLNNSLDKDGSITGTAITKNADGSVTRTGFRISGNGRDVQTEMTGMTTTSQDENGNTKIKDSKLGTFAVNQDPNDPSKYNLTQVEDADGNEVDPDNALHMSFRDKEAEGAEEAANNLVNNSGLEQMQNRVDEAQNFANMSAEERKEAGADISDINQDALNNVVADKLSNGDTDYLGENGKISSVQLDDEGNLTATVTNTDNGVTTMQNYAIGAGGATPIGSGTKISCTEDGKQAAFLNEDTGTAFTMQKTTDSKGRSQWQVTQCNLDGSAMENGMKFTVPAKNGESAQDAAIRVAGSDEAASSRERYNAAVETMQSGDTAAMNGMDYNSHEARAAYGTLYGSEKDGVTQGSTLSKLTRNENGTTATYLHSDTGGTSREVVTRADGQSEPISRVSTHATITPSGDGDDSSRIVVSNSADKSTYEAKPVGTNGDRTVYGVRQLTDGEGKQIIDAPERTFELPTVQNGRATTMNDVSDFMVSDKGMNIMNGLNQNHMEAQSGYREFDSTMGGTRVENGNGYASAIATDIASGDFVASGESSPNATPDTDLQQAFAQGTGKIFVNDTRNEHGGLSVDAVYNDQETGREVMTHMEQQSDGSFKMSAPFNTHPVDEDISNYYQNVGKLASAGVQDLGDVVYDGMLSERNTPIARKAFAEAADIPAGEEVSTITIPTKKNPYIGCTTTQELPLNEQENPYYASHEVVRTRVMSGVSGGDVSGRADILTAKSGKECVVSLFESESSDSPLNRMVLTDFTGTSVTIRHDDKVERIRLKDKYTDINKVAAKFVGVKDGDDFKRVLGQITGKGSGEKPKGKKKR